jgi:hypothetical protein
MIAHVMSILLWKIFSSRSTIKPMRRVSAALLIAVFGLALIGSALFASDPDTNLPACCRRLGKHHCAMVAESTPSSGPALQVSRCPVFNTAGGLPPTRPVSLPEIVQMALAVPVSHSKLQQQPESLCGSSYSYANRKRGPPHRLS